MKERYKDLPWHSREVIGHQYALTDSERLELAKQMADARAEVMRLENELAALKKDYKEKIDMYAGEFSQAAIKFKSGLADPVEIECDVYQDFDHEEMVYVTVDGMEELQRRPMKENEKMPSLFSYIPDTQATISHFSK